MSVAIITGAGGLVGSEAAKFFAAKGLNVVGIDNDMRSRLFGVDASTRWSWTSLQKKLPCYSHVEADIRDGDAIGRVFARYGSNIAVVIHAAGQPSHDWATKEPSVDFAINAVGTQVVLEASRKYCPNGVFIFCSTNKVYGDAPNHLPLVECKTRWELLSAHPFGPFGIDETMSIDHTMHSLYGVSKCAADLLVQEYGRYFGMKTACFRAGCLTGPGHAGTQQHGFLSFLVKCAVTKQPYTILGYQGKQVRDNLHAFDLINAFWLFFESPQIGEVYNIGGGRQSNCSVIEAIRTIEELTGEPLAWSHNDVHRPGDHIWWISDTRRFEGQFPSWRLTYDISTIVSEIYGAHAERLRLAQVG
jgi:CDP-paratose 2-epimerase